MNKSREIYLCGDETLRFVEEFFINQTGQNMTLHRAKLALDQTRMVIASAGSRVIIRSETNHPDDNREMQQRVARILDILNVNYNVGFNREGWDPDFWIQAAPIHKRANFKLNYPDYYPFKDF